MIKPSPDTEEEKQTEIPVELQFHSSNPFMDEIVEYVGESKTRKAVSSSWQDVVDKSTGNTTKQRILILGEQKVVDAQEYSKVYMGSIERFFGLSKSSGKLLDYIMRNIRYGNDRICIPQADIKEQLGMIKSTMYTCIRQLLMAKIIAKASTPGCYYINPAVVFKGDRVALVQQWVCEKEIPEPKTIG